jgi:uncharacterized protein YijF (DUF1287 family)
MLARGGLLLALALVSATSALARPAMVLGARAQVGVTTTYDPSYSRLAYPGGDVPADRGVCADVVVRALRRTGVDLQALVHEDMRANFAAYPHAWGLRGPDPNIDHRRVLNLETFLRRRGFAQPGAAAADFQAGDIVSWRLPGGLPHIGIVSDRVAADGSGRRLVIHNVGAGTREEDVLLAWPRAGHFRWVWARAHDQPGAGRASPNDRPGMAGPGDQRSSGFAMDGDASTGWNDEPGTGRARPRDRSGMAGPGDQHSNVLAMDGNASNRQHHASGADPARRHDVPAMAGPRDQRSSRFAMDGNVEHGPHGGLSR